MPRPSRSEARLLRKEAEKIDQAAKSARLLERPEFQQVRIGAEPTSIYQMTAVITCEAPDRAGNWQRSGTVRDWTDAQWASVNASVVQWTKLTWAEIASHTSDTGHHMHHDMAVDVISDEAQTRLLELDRVEADTIFRFRLGNLPRLWGFRHGATFDVLWYDREHDVYPTDPS